jgi:hypothetical protein
MVLSLHLSGVSEETSKSLSQDSRCPNEGLGSRIPEYEGVIQIGLQSSARLPADVLQDEGLPSLHCGRSAWSPKIPDVGRIPLFTTFYVLPLR